MDHMRYLTFSQIEQPPYEICLLVPQLNRGDIERHYLGPHLSGSRNEIVAYTVYKEGKKTPVKVQREYLDELLPVLRDLGTKYLVTCDADYFKTLTKVPSADKALGYVLSCTHPGFEDMHVIYCPNTRLVFYNPEKVEAQIRIALETLNNHRAGTYNDPGLDVIKFAAYPDTVESIELWLQRLLDMECSLSADIEAFSLKHYDAGIGTITFCWNKHEGIAFPVDLLDDLGDQIRVRALLKEFFIEFARRS